MVNDYDKSLLGFIDTHLRPFYVKESEVIKTVVDMYFDHEDRFGDLNINDFGALVRAGVDLFISSYMISGMVEMEIRKRKKEHRCEDKQYDS